MNCEIRKTKSGIAISSTCRMKKSPGIAGFRFVKVNVKRLRGEADEALLVRARRELNAFSH